MKRTKSKPKSKAKRKRVPLKPYIVDVRICVEFDHAIEVTARNHEEARKKALKIADEMIYDPRLLDGETWDFGFEVQNIERADLSNAVFRTTRYEP